MNLVENESFQRGPSCQRITGKMGSSAGGLPEKTTVREVCCLRSALCSAAVAKGTRSRWGVSDVLQPIFGAWSGGTGSSFSATHRKVLRLTEEFQKLGNLKLATAISRGPKNLNSVMYSVYHEAE